MVVEGRIAAYIEKKGIMQIHVARNAGIEQSRFSRMMNGNASLSADEYERVCNALEVTPDTFMVMTFKRED